MKTLSQISNPKSPANLERMHVADFEEERGASAGGEAGAGDLEIAR
jgi:hypothetical protein